MAAPLPLRRNRDFLYLWNGHAVSALGSQASRVAYPLLVLAITGSAAKAGLASAAATLPYLLFPLLAGAYADRHDRRRIMIACDVLRLVALCGAFAAPWLQRRMRPGVIITSCVGAWAVFIALLAAVRSPVWLCPVAAAIGVAGSPWNVAVQTSRLRIIPNHVLARVSSVTFQVAWGAIPLGSLLAAALLRSMSATRVAVIIAIALAVTAAAATASASMRRAGSAADQALTPKDLTPASKG